MIIYISCNYFQFSKFQCYVLCSVIAEEFVEHTVVCAFYVSWLVLVVIHQQAHRECKDKNLSIMHRSDVPSLL